MAPQIATKGLFAGRIINKVNPNNANRNKIHSDCAIPQTKATSHLYFRFTIFKHIAALAQLLEASRLEREGWGWTTIRDSEQFYWAPDLWRAWEANSLTRHHFGLSQSRALMTPARRSAGWRSDCNPARSGCQHHLAHVVQRRDSGLKIRPVLVQIQPWAPTACSPMKRRSAQTGEVAGASPATRTNFGMSTGQAGRACLLNSACLTASGACPRHSAISVSFVCFC